MKNCFKYAGSILAAVAFIMMLPGCEEYKIPPKIYPIQGVADPVISAVNPTEASDGVLEIHITGQNFSPTVDKNIVFFGQAEGRVVSASETEIVVVRPMNVSGDSVSVHVENREAFGIGLFSPYKMEPGLVTVNDTLTMFAIAMDASENLYAAVSKPANTVLKITPDGEVTEYGQLTKTTASAMRMGPGGVLYVQKADNNTLYSIPAGGGAAAEFIRFNRKVSFFDFDENGNIFAGGNANGLFCAKPDGSSNKQVGDYKTTGLVLPIAAVRVYQGYVYVAVSDPVYGGVWRNAITAADGTLGERERILDWTTTGSYSATQIMDITFSEDGDLYVATNSATNPVLVVSGGSIAPLYTGLLPSPATQILWGNGRYLYMNKSDLTHNGIIRMIMGKNGAVYYGR